MSDFTSELISICRMFMVFERNVVCCGDVTVQQCVVLQELLAAEADVSRLSQSSGVSLSAMTRLVDGLERRELVERRRDDGDRRKVFVRLTPKGRAEAKRLRALTEKAVGAVLSRIPKSKHKQIFSMLGLVREAMDDARTTFGV